MYGGMNMKKEYETPVAEKVNFQYQEQVAASGSVCTEEWKHTGDTSCTSQQWVRNLND